MATLDPHAKVVEALRSSEARIAAAIDRVGRCTLAAPKRTAEAQFEALVETIVAQQLSPKAADTIFQRVRRLGGDGDHLDAKTLLALDPQRLREAGLSTQKASYVRDLCGRMTTGEISFEALEAMGDDEAIRKLSEIKGIGTWTAEVFLLFRLGRLDILPTGDLGIQKGIMRLFALRKMPAPEKMTKLAAPWRPYRSIASWYLWQDNALFEQAKRVAKKAKTNA